MWIELKSQKTILHLETGNTVNLEDKQVVYHIVSSPNGYGRPIDSYETKQQAQARYEEIKNTLLNLNGASKIEYQLARIKEQLETLVHYKGLE